MKCQRAEDQFSERFDDSLPPDAAAAFEQHLAACAACRAGYASFAAAVERLRALEVAATSPGYAENVSAAVFAQGAPQLALTPRVWRRTTLLILSHAAALLLGWFLFHLAEKPANGDGKSDAVAYVEPPTPVYIEVPVEKRVEIRVEVPVEVPVEVIREVAVQHTEYVDRPVPNPLQLRLDQQLAVVADFAGAFREVLVLARLASERAARDSTLRAEPPVPVAELVATLPATNNTKRAPMVVLREDGLVSIRTYGTAADVVPSLIAALDDPDRELAAAAEQHLDSIRARLAREAGEVSASPSASVATLPVERSGLRAWWSSLSGAAREEAVPEATTRERWQTWWNERSSAQADTRAE